jgi:hypothetical protein
VTDKYQLSAVIKSGAFFFKLNNDSELDVYHHCTKIRVFDIGKSQPATIVIRVGILDKSDPAKNRNLNGLISNLNRLSKKHLSTP